LSIKREFLVAYASGPEPQGLATEFHRFVTARAGPQRISVRPGDHNLPEAHKNRKIGHDYFCLDGDAFFGNTGCVTKNVFFIGLIIAASGLVSPPIALAGGLIYGFSFIHPFHLEAKQLSKLLLQASVVGLGFGMDLQQVMQAGRSGFIYTAGSISIALLLGWGWEDYCA